MGGIFCCQPFNKSIIDNELMLDNDLEFIHFSVFYLKVFKYFNKINPYTSISISPLSIYLSIALIANGAGGSTAKELLQLLQSSTIEDLNQYSIKQISDLTNKNTIKIANAVISQVVPKNDFIKKCQEYQAYYDTVDNIDKVNQLCRKHNNKTFLSTFKSDSYSKLINEKNMMLIATASYNNVWKESFNDIENNDMFYGIQHFTNSSGKKTKCQWMWQLSSQLYYQDETCQVIQLNSNDNNLKTIIILPRNSIDQYISQISSQMIHHLIHGLTKKNIYLLMPKFTIDYQSDLVKAVQCMDEGFLNCINKTKADYSLISHNNLYLNSIRHETYLQVDSKGLNDSPKSTLKHTIDWDGYDLLITKPFLYLLIQDNDVEHMLFMTKVEDVL